MLREHDGQHQFRRRASVTYVALGTDGRIAGVVTVCPHADARRSRTGLPKLPAFPLPILLIPRLAVSTSGRGGGLGKLLLRQALVLTTELADSVGCVGAVVDAKSAAVSFYIKPGFVELTATQPSTEPRLFLPISLIPTRAR